MMRLLFLCIFLINFVFFIWEYRKGAPEIYLPQSYENSQGTTKYAQKIELLTETNNVAELSAEGSASKKTVQQSVALSDIGVENEALEQATMLQTIADDTSPQRLNSETIAENIHKEPDDKLIALKSEESAQSFPAIKQLATHRTAAKLDKNSSVEETSPEIIIEKDTQRGSQQIEPPKSVSNEQETIASSASLNNISAKPLPLFACYQLKKGEYTQQALIKKMQGHTYKLESFEQQLHISNNYLVLTLAANSSEQAANIEQEIKQKGISDLWLFPEGTYKWRISLGLFVGLERAKKAKKILSEQAKQVLEVVPSYPPSMLTSIKISTGNEQGMFAFEQEFSDILDQQVECKA